MAPKNLRSIVVAGAWLSGWALLDTATGAASGSSNSSSMRNTVESMIKPWIVADYLRRAAAKGQRPSTATLNELTLMIIDSNDPMAEKYYRIGGSDDVIERFISVCKLSGVKIKSTYWSFTEISPRTAIGYGKCLADGRAAGPQWTSWLLNVMKRVRGKVTDQKSGAVEGGRWGIIDGLPPVLAKDTSIKNGWTLYKDGWHINCLAIHPTFILVVMMRTNKGLTSGAAACKAVAEALVVEP